MHVRVGLRPRIIVRQFPPMVGTYLKSMSGNFWVPARTLIAVKLLIEMSVWCLYAFISDVMAVLSSIRYHHGLYTLRTADFDLITH